MKTVLLFSFSILLVNCNKENNQNTIITEFPETILISGAPIEEIEVLSGGNVNLLVVDTFLVIQKREPKLFSVYSTNNHKKLVEFGTIGRGPEEFINPELTKQISYDPNTNSPIVHVYDYDRRKLSKINIIEAITNKEKAIIQQPIPPIEDYIVYFFHQDEDFLLATPEQGSRFIKYDFKSGNSKLIPYLPELDFSIDKNSIQSVYRSAVSVNKNKNIIAATPMGIGEIDFFDLDGNYIKSSIFESRKNLKNSLDSKDNPKHYIAHLESRKDYLYGLNKNNNPVKLYKTNDYDNLELLVFNWEGEAIKKYILEDNKFIRSFSIDTIHNRLYGYNAEETTNNIIVYDLND